jgi:CRISPR-associated protein Cmr2
MGKWVSGKKMLKVKDLLHPKSVEALYSFWDKEKKEDLEKILNSFHPMSPSFHNGFSRRLSNFALNDVKKIVESKYYGKLIYAGGDDILAFLPVEDAFPCSMELQKIFKEKYLERASMSTGIVFVHHKYPLQLALNETREAEKLAKSKFGRNACCLKLLKNSGEARVIGFKLDEKNIASNITLSEFFSKIISLYREEKLSSKFAYDFMHIVDEIGEQKEENVRKILLRELKRIYLHKTPAEKQDHQFLDDMLNIFDNWEYDYRDFANIFIIGRFVSQNGWE